MRPSTSWTVDVLIRRTTKLEALVKSLEERIKVLEKNLKEHVEF